MISLPQELLDTIIDEVHDSATLKSCALVATSFVPPCQRNLFRTFRLRGRSPSLGDVLAESPHLGLYIRTLTIEMWDTASNFATVRVALGLVQHIEYLVVSGKSIVWSRLGYDISSVSSALLDCLSRPSLRRLDLLNMQRVPAALILASTVIPVVSFFRVFMDSGEEISGQLHDSTPTPRLRHLLLADAGPAVLRICNFLLHAKNPPYTEQIERLEIRINSESATYDARLLTACAKSLKYLVIDPGDPISIPHLPLVRGVEIKVFVGDNRRFPAFFNSNFSQIASSLPLVETITLVFVVEPLYPEVAWPDQGPLPVLGPSFVSRMQLLHLRQVHCKLLQRSAFGSMRALFDRFVTAMESKMPGLQGTGILTCTLV